MKKIASLMQQHNDNGCIRRLRFPTLLMVFVTCALLLCSTAFAATAHSVDDAINWCYSQIGVSIDTDGFPYDQPYQCVDLIKAYYQYLGVSPVSGNGEDYAWNALPSGWTRVQGGTPQRGDILVYSESSSNIYGHVAIFESTYSTFHQNMDGKFYVDRFSYAYNGISNPYWGYIRPDFISNGQLDLNGLLDGENAGSLSDYGTCDVYINGSMVADDVNDYCVSWPVGTTYSITDIKAKDGFEYTGINSGSLSGTVTTAGVNVQLAFLSYGTLAVTGKLDGLSDTTIEGFGTFDVYINGVLSSSAVSAYNQKWPQGTTYEIKNIQTSDGKYYNGVISGILSGTLAKGTMIVEMSFATIIEADAAWHEADTLPGYLDLSTVEIQYNNHYKKTSTDSPGAEWTQVASSDVTTYVNSGNVYESDFALTTSDTRVHVGTYYYHYCYSGCSDVEHYNDGVHTVYHNAGDINQFYTDWEGADSTDSRYTAYRIKWVYGEWANGYAYCSLGSPAVYYRRYQYQDRVVITNYDWQMESGWTTELDDTADFVTYRFRLKNYEVTFDANGGENAPEPQTKFCTMDLTLPETVPTRSLYQFAGWNTQADGSGTAYAAADLYTEDANVTLYAQWIPLTKVLLPSDLVHIGNNAFEGIGAVIIEIQNGCESIGAEAFLNCKNLERLYIPASVTDISFDAFDGCDKVTICAPEGSKALLLAARLNLSYEVIE